MNRPQKHPDIIKHVREISSKTKYPIKNFGQLMKALGGESAPIEFEGWRAPAGRLREFIPEHYFPVASEEDLLAKSEELRLQYMGAGKGEPEAPGPVPKEFRDFPKHGLDMSRVRPPQSEAQGGVARLPEK